MHGNALLVYLHPNFFHHESNRVEEHCVGVETRLEAFGHDLKAIDEDARLHRHFLGLLREACNLLRTADSDTTDPRILDRINQTLNKGIRLGYGTSVGIEHMPSFAHSDEDGHPALEGPHREDGIFSHRMTEPLTAMAKIVAKRHPESVNEPPLFLFPPPWSTTPRPHPLGSPLSRFQTEPICPPSASDLLTSVYQARCEILSTEVHLPVTLAHSSACIVLPSMGGYKNRTPKLSYYLLDIPAEDSGQDFPFDPRHADVRLSQIAYSAAIDDERKLIFVADDSQIKSYAWGSSTGEIYESARPTHTHRCSNSKLRTRGPLAVLPGGRVLRASKGLADLWNLDELETHGVDGMARIGKRIRIEDAMRDDADMIEDSAGSPASLVIPFADSAFAVICATELRMPGDSSFISLDLEGGKTGARYLGVGGEITGFSTSAAGPNAFLCSANDGYARLYDVRVRLPVLSLAAGYGATSCSAALFVHPDSVPMVLPARKKRRLYVSGTCAPAPQSSCTSFDREQPGDGMEWDGERSWIGWGIGRVSPGEDTSCRTPKRGEEAKDEQEDEEDGDDDDYARCWPRKAAHAEEYFGHLFDAGEHRILRYAFKEQPDLIVLPVYGDATATSRSSFW
ncbi:hypothetical protein B0H13DRAFT_2312280 [Mycena leptocephala]|nr:hypothetical protein B0H13DRAFT_2312280 [Mycena leptocephala]